MIIPIAGNLKLSFPVDEIDVDVSAFSLTDGEDDFPVTYAFNWSAEDRTASLRGSLKITKEQIETDAGKAFEQCTMTNIRRAIRRVVVAHVRATI